MKQFSIFVCSLFCCIQTFAQQLSVSFPDSLLKQPFSGNIIVYLSKGTKEPKDMLSLLESAPCFRVNVKNIRPGAAVTIDDKAVYFPVPLSDIERGQYFVQVVWDRNLGGQSIGQSPGNLYSSSRKINFTKDRAQTFTIAADKIVPEKEFKQTEFVKELRVPSRLLSDFHHQSYYLNAAVRLPKEYFTQPNRRFPVKFSVFGFGGNYHNLSNYNEPMDPIDTIPCIGVYLDGNCPLGHSVYANSENNGPWSDALIKELIPQLEKTYRTNGQRLLFGHSSGGWTVLWLQTQYPEVFTATWSSSPDPVDFNNFQQVNLYAHDNFYYDADSTLRPVGTVAGVLPWISMRNAWQMERVLYRGEQMHSFEAVFSKKGADGNPERILNDETGEIDTTVLKHWQQYDIAAYLVKNWVKVKDKLDGKVRISVGNQDNFLLNYAIKLLEEKMGQLHASFVFAYYPGDHFTVRSPQWIKDGDEFFKSKLK